jgi:hypothetical protein
MRSALLLLAALAAGCAAAAQSPPNANPKAADQAALEACLSRLCPPRVEVTIQERCAQTARERFDALPDAAARRGFLREAGCAEPGAVAP